MSSDYEKKKNKNKTSALLKVPQVVPQKPARTTAAQRRRTIESSSACRRTRMRRACKHLSDRRAARQEVSRMRLLSSGTLFFSSEGTHGRAFPAQAAGTRSRTMCTAACKHLSDWAAATRSQPYAASQQNRQMFSARKADRAAAQSAAERIYCEQEQRRRQPDADAVPQELHGLAQDQRSEQKTAARAERRLRRAGIRVQSQTGAF